jgi:hypothetical protein
MADELKLDMVAPHIDLAMARLDEASESSNPLSDADGDDASDRNALSGGSLHHG